MLMMLLQVDPAIREWWDYTLELGLVFGYYLNAMKTWLIVKDIIWMKLMTSSKIQEYQ